MIKNKYTLSDFNFELPKELISQDPIYPRENGKLLEVKSNILTDHTIKDLPNLINSKDLLIINNTKVIKSRIVATRNSSKFIITLHKPLADGTWMAFCTKSKRIHKGDALELSNKSTINIVNKKDSGEIQVKFNTKDNIHDILNEIGFIPLPPYIKRKNINNKEDESNYQPIFAKNKGAVASPTASLHFTNELIQKIKDKGIKIAEVTLHVGAGTFLPVKTNNIEDHIMHKEYGEVSKKTYNLIQETKKNKGRIISVGTTSLRIIEHIASLKENPFIKSDIFKGETDIFIYPGYNFKIIDVLITNFHTPQSTLFMLVCAFIGLNNIKKAYSYAIENKYRFFSYGDCTFLHKGENN